MEQEHWNEKNGRLLGLWAVDATKARGVDIWDRVDEVVASYTALHPLQIEKTVRENIKLKEIQMNEFASTGSKSLRWGAEIPPGLLFKIEAIAPQIFREKTLFHKFLKRYPGFAICQTV
jgi:hypothetical protein